MKTLLLSIALLSRITFAADTGLDPEKVEAKIYGVYLSTSEFCTGAVETFSDSAPTYKDFLSGPTLVDADNADGHLNGTYKCIIIKMSDQIRVTPKTTSTSGHCVAGTAFVTPICNTGGAQTTKDLEGTVTTCTDAEDVVYLYVAAGTAAGSDGNNTFLPPTSGDTNNGVNLASDLVILGSHASEFVINANGQVGEGGGECGMDRPTFTFR